MSAAEPLPQHLQALEKANRVRLGMAEMKRKIHRGDVALEVLFDPDHTGDLSVSELLQAFPRWGATRARKFLNSIRAVDTSSARTMRTLEGVKIRDLTLRERRILAEACGETSTITNHLRQEN